MPPNELASVIRLESRNIFPFDADEAQVDFLSAGEVRQAADVRQEVIVLAARKADVDRFAEQLHATGVIIDSLDIELCSLYRTVERFVRRRDDEQEVHVLIDLGMKRSQVIIGRGREVSFFKMIDIGGSQLNDAVSHKLGIAPHEARVLRRRQWMAETTGGQRDPVRQAILDATRSTMENLAKEISLCLRYYSVTFRGQRPNRVRLLGGEAADPQLLAILNSVLNVPVEAGRPLFNFECDAVKGLDRKLPSGEWAMAVGLALRHTEGHFAPLDGTPRAASAGTPPAPAEVVDLNVLIPPPSKDSQNQQDHFAAIRRATVVEEKINA
jgi:type IV pilus assembly protein PilM